LASLVPVKEEDMRGLNTVILIGRLGRAPEIRTAKESGAHWGTFTMATNRGVKVGEAWEEVTDWHRVKCFGKLADRCGSYLMKGSLVAVEGSVQTEKWTDDEGRRRYSTAIVADSVTFLDTVQQAAQRAVEVSTQIEA